MFTSLISKKTKLKLLGDMISRQVDILLVFIWIWCGVTCDGDIYKHSHISVIYLKIFEE